MALSLLPKILGLGKDIIVASVFGTSSLLDAYLMGMVLIGLPVAIFIVALQTVLVPKIIEKGVGTDAAAALSGTAMKQAAFILIACLPVWLYLLPGALVALYPRAEPDAHALVLQACYWLIPYYFFNGFNWLAYGVLQAGKMFWPNALLPSFFPLAIMAIIAAYPQADIRTLLLGTVTGSALEFTFLVFLLVRTRLVSWKQSDPADHVDLFKQAAPLMIGAVVTAFSPMIEQMLAYRLGPGSVAELGYGSKLAAALSGMIVMAVGVTVLPHFSELVSKCDWAGSKHLQARLTLWMGLGGLVLALALIALSEPLVRLMFERGAFGAQDTAAVSLVQQAYLLQIPLWLMGIVSLRMLAALSKTRLLASISVIQLVVGTMLGFWWSALFGVPGIGLAVAVGWGIALVMYFYSARRYLTHMALSRESVMKL